LNVIKGGYLEGLMFYEQTEENKICKKALHKEKSKRYRLF